MSLNLDTLHALAAARGLTDAELARRSELGIERFKAVLADPDGAKIKDIAKLAHTLGVDELVLHASPEALPLHPMPDFRRADRGTATLHAETYRAIDAAYAIRALILESSSLPFEVALSKKLAGLSPKDAAKAAREHMNFSFSEQLEAPSASAFYARLRMKIEAENIFVIQDSFPVDDGAGFTISSQSEPNIIVINTKSVTYGRRSFTLSHEFYHVLLGETGISAPFSDTKVERQCDIFAANFLMPEAELRNLVKEKLSTWSDLLPAIRRLAGWLHMSQEAVAVRLEELLIAPGIYRRWRAEIGPRNPDFDRKRGGSSVPQEVVKLAKYGFSFARAISDALARGTTSYIRVYRASGLKRDYGPAYFSYARHLSSSVDNLASIEM